MTTSESSERPPAPDGLTIPREAAVRRWLWAAVATDWLVSVGFIAPYAHPDGLFEPPAPSQRAAGFVALGLAIAAALVAKVLQGTRQQVANDHPPKETVDAWRALYFDTTGLLFSGAIIVALSLLPATGGIAGASTLLAGFLSVASIGKLTGDTRRHLDTLSRTLGPWALRSALTDPGIWDSSSHGDGAIALFAVLGMPIFALELAGVI